MLDWDRMLTMSLAEWAALFFTATVLGGLFWPAVARLIAAPVPWAEERERLIAQRDEAIRHEAEALAEVERLEEDRHLILSDPAHYRRLRYPAAIDSAMTDRLRFRAEA